MLRKEDELNKDDNKIIDDLYKMTKEEILSLYNNHIQNGNLEIED